MNENSDKKACSTIAIIFIISLVLFIFLVLFDSSFRILAIICGGGFLLLIASNYLDEKFDLDNGMSCATIIILIFIVAIIILSFLFG